MDWWRTFWADFGDRTYYSDTASVGEVFVPVGTAVLWAFWGAMFWWYRRKGESPFRDGAPRWQIAFAWASPVLLGFVAIMFTYWAFMPGNLAG